MTEQLKPCPFCGSDPRVRKRQDESLWSHNIVTWTAVGCPECEVEFDWPEGGESNAAEEWNRRAAEDDLRALALSLAEALQRHCTCLPLKDGTHHEACICHAERAVLSDPRLAAIRGE